MQKKILAALLTLCMLLSVAPLAVSAADEHVHSWADKACTCGAKAITNVSDLLELMNDFGSDKYPANGHYVLTGDSYDLSNESSAKPIGTAVYDASARKLKEGTENPFTGTFDGNGKTVKINMTGDTCVGLFGYVSGATIKNLTVSGTVSGVHVVGGVVGYAATGTTVSGCTNECTVTGTATATVTAALVGGVVGYAYDKTADIDNITVEITNCTNNGDIAGKDGETTREDVGGIAGIAWYAKVTSCTNTGAVEGSKSVGGIVGRSLYAMVEDCNNSNESKTVKGTQGNFGGIIGQAQSATSVTGCVNSAPVTGTDSGNAGGIIGYVNGEGTSTKQCSNTGAVEGKSIVGGIVGYAQSAVSVSQCQNSGTVTATVTTGKANVGGIAGATAGATTISYCLNTGNVYCKAYYAGGFIGQTKGTTAVSYCYTTGTVYNNNVAVTSTKDGNSYIQGFCGCPTYKSFTACYYSSSGTPDPKTYLDNALFKVYSVAEFDTLNTKDATTNNYFWIKTKTGPELKYFHDQGHTNGATSCAACTCDHSENFGVITFTSVSDTKHKCSNCKAELDHKFTNSECACGLVQLTITSLTVEDGSLKATFANDLGSDATLDASEIEVSENAGTYTVSGLKVNGNYVLASDSHTIDASYIGTVTATVDGEDAGVSIPYIKGMSVEVTLSAPADKEGYDFAGWKVDGTTYTTSTFTIPASKTNTDSLVIEAVYTEQTVNENENQNSNVNYNNNVALFVALAARNSRQCVVTYKSTGANTHVYETVKKGTVLQMPEVPTKDGYTFAGWYKDINCVRPFDFTSKITGSVSIYAKWVKN